MRQSILPVLSIIVLLSGCLNAGPPAPPTATPTIAVRSLPAHFLDTPTPIPPSEVTPTNTLVMSQPWTPTPIPSATPFPSESFGLVVGVLSTDTIAVVLEGDSLNTVYTVRLLGVDPLPAIAAQPWGVVAARQMNNWLLGTAVRLVQDTTIVDDNNQLPRYVYLKDELINLKLVELGLARAEFSPPDVRLQAQIQAAADAARDAEIGLWGPPPTATPTMTPTGVLTPTISITAMLTLTGTPVITASPTITFTATPGGG